MENIEIIGICPLCGGDIVKTNKGYACEQHLSTAPMCNFFIPGIICNRKISEDEVRHFLNHFLEILDGFSTNEGKIFSSLMTIKNGNLALDSHISTCPVCGGNLLVGIRAFNCSNQNNEQKPCHFFLWRNIAGHEISASECKQICEHGQTENPCKLYNNNGKIYHKYLALSQDKSRIIKK